MSGTYAQTWVCGKHYPHDEPEEQPASEDCPWCEIARLRELVETAFYEGYYAASETDPRQSDWQESSSRAALRWRGWRRQLNHYWRGSREDRRED